MLSEHALVSGCGDVAGFAIHAQLPVTRRTTVGIEFQQIIRLPGVMPLEPNILPVTVNRPGQALYHS
jgi:hypothetical protein